MNGFWDRYEKDAELLWSYVLRCAEFDTENHGAGTALDEMNAHRFLESFKETQTVRQMRDNLRSTGAIGPNDRPKTVPLTHWLVKI